MANAVLQTLLTDSFILQFILFLSFIHGLSTILSLSLVTGPSLRRSARDIEEEKLKLA